MDLNSCCCIYYHRNPTNSHYFNRIPTFLSNPPRHTHTKPLFWRQNHPIRVRALNDDGFVLEVMPHLIDSPLFYKQTFVGPEDVVAEQIVLEVYISGEPVRERKVTDKSFGIDTAVKAAQRATNAAHVEIESEENGVGIVNLMGRYFLNIVQKMAI